MPEPAIPSGFRRRRLRRLGWFASAVAALALIAFLRLLRPPADWPDEPASRADAAPSSMAAPAGALLASVVEAHGGLERWRRIERLRIRLRFGGLAFRLRFAEPDSGPRWIEVDLDRPRVLFHDFPERGRTGIFTSDRVWIEGENGRLLAERRDPRELLMRSRLRQLRWRDLDLLYFAGYACWNYFQGPFLLLRDGVETWEIEPWSENGESWRRILARFPASFPTHSSEQVFYFDRAFRQRRHDYVPRPYAGWARAAHRSSEYLDFAGLSFPTRRTVHPRGADGGVRAHPVLVWIELLDLEPVERSAR